MPYHFSSRGNNLVNLICPFSFGPEGFVLRTDLDFLHCLFHKGISFMLLKI